MQPHSTHETISALCDNQLSATERVQAENLVQRDPEARRMLTQFELLGSWVRALPRYRLAADFEQRVLQLIERELLARRTSGDGLASAATRAHELSGSSSANANQTLPIRAGEENGESLAELVPSRTSWIWGLVAVAASLLLALWAFPDSLRQQHVALHDPETGAVQAQPEGTSDSPSLNAQIGAWESRTGDARTAAPPDLAHGAQQSDSANLRLADSPNQGNSASGLGGLPAGGYTTTPSAPPAAAALPAAPPKSLTTNQADQALEQPVAPTALPGIAAKQDSSAELAKSSADAADDVLLVCRLPNEAALQAALARFDALLNSQGIAIDLPGEESVDGRLASTPRGRPGNGETAKTGPGGQERVEGQRAASKPGDALSRNASTPNRPMAPTENAPQLAGADKLNQTNALRKGLTAAEPATATQRVYVIDAQADRLSAALEELAKFGNQGIEGLQISTVNLPSSEVDTTRLAANRDADRLQAFKWAQSLSTTTTGSTPSAAAPRTVAPQAGSSGTRQEGGPTAPTAGSNTVDRSPPQAPADAEAEKAAATNSKAAAPRADVELIVPENTARRLELKSLPSATHPIPGPIKSEGSAPGATAPEGADKLQQRQQVKDREATPGPDARPTQPLDQRSIPSDEQQPANGATPSAREKRRNVEEDRHAVPADAKGSPPSPTAPVVRLRRAVVVFQIEPAIAAEQPPAAGTSPTPAPR